MKCETCKKEIGEQMLAQYNKVCFSCYYNGLFFELTGYQRNQLKAARKHGNTEIFKQGEIKQCNSQEPKRKS